MNKKKIDKELEEKISELEVLHAKYLSFAFNTDDAYSYNLKLNECAIIKGQILAYRDIKKELEWLISLKLQEKKGANNIV